MRFERFNPTAALGESFGELRINDRFAPLEVRSEAKPGGRPDFPGVPKFEKFANALEVRRPSRAIKLVGRADQVDQNGNPSPKVKTVCANDVKRFARRRNRVDEFAQVFALSNSERRPFRSKPNRARRRRFGRFVGRGVVEKRIEKNAPVERVRVVERGVEPIVERHNRTPIQTKRDATKQNAPG